MAGKLTVPQPHGCLIGASICACDLPHLALLNPATSAHHRPPPFTASPEFALGHTRFAVLSLIAIALAACAQVGFASPPDAAPPVSGAAPRAAIVDASLTVSAGGVTRTFTSAELLARSDAATVAVPRDPAYGGRATTYRAVPLRALLAQLPADAADTFEMRATDGFVAQLPSQLLISAATPWIAVEDPAQPWPPLPGQKASAGPFFLIWENAERAGISPEQWPYALASMTAVASPVQRWPALAVYASMPADAPARRGQAVFMANCLACHRMAGNGEGAVGPDLLRPMPASRYFTEVGLSALIRNPAAVRKWPQQMMPAFDASVISEADIDALIAYLRLMTARAAP